MKQINLTTFRDKWNAYKHDPKSLLLFIAVCLAAAITLAALAFVRVFLTSPRSCSNGNTTQRTSL